MKIAIPNATIGSRNLPVSRYIPNIPRATTSNIRKVAADKQVSNSILHEKFAQVQGNKISLDVLRESSLRRSAPGNDKIIAPVKNRLVETKLQGWRDKKRVHRIIPSLTKLSIFSEKSKSTSQLRLTGRNPVFSKVIKSDLRRDFSFETSRSNPPTTDQDQLGILENIEEGIKKLMKFEKMLTRLERRLK